MTHPHSHGYRIWTYTIHIGRSGTNMYMSLVVYKAKGAVQRTQSSSLGLFPPFTKQDDSTLSLLHSFLVQASSSNFI